MLHSILFSFVVFFQVIVYGSYSVLVHLCEIHGTISFSSTTMNLIIEFVKLIFSLIASIYLKELNFKNYPILLQLKQSIPYSIPAIVYFLNNNLAIHIQIYMDSTSYQLLSNFKIFTTAILYRLIIKTKLTYQQWFALLLLFFGGFAYCLSTFNNSLLISKSQTNSTKLMSEMYIHPLGIPMIAIYCTLSGLAGVYSEWILKRNYNQSLYLQNTFLYAYGTFLNLISTISVMIIASNTTDCLNLFHGFTFYTWLIVISQVLNGLLMSIVIKHSSNIIRLFIISFSLVITTLLSSFIFQTNFNMYFFISFITMIGAVFLYYTNSITSGMTKKKKSSLC